MDDKKIIELFFARDEAALDGVEKKYGARIFWCADEMYVRSGTPYPPYEYWGEFSQIENGVGLIRDMKSSVDFELEDLSPYADFKGPREISVATGYAAYEHILDISQKLESAFDGLRINVYRIKNNFFGETITVAPGTYPVVLDITGAKNFTLKAAGEVVFAGVAHETNGSNSQVIFDGITIDNSIIATRAEGGWFTGTAPNIKPCVGAWGGNFTFEDCRLLRDNG